MYGDNNLYWKNKEIKYTRAKEGCGTGYLLYVKEVDGIYEFRLRLQPENIYQFTATCQ